jgi:long-chain fatty acid transport protein
MKLPSAVLIAVLACVCPHDGLSLGFRIADQDADATARGDAFAATADNPSAIYYNPAGITQLDGTQTLLGSYAISLKEKVSLDAPGPNSTFDSVNTKLQVAPQAYVTYKPEQYPITIGIGVYAPFGFAVEYPDGAAFRTLALRGGLQYVTLNPVLAWKICDTLSVAAGPTFNYGDVDLERGVIAPGDDFKFKGNGVAYGYNAGIMWAPLKEHHFGLTYRSQTSLNFQGHTTVDTNPFTVPTAGGPVTVPGTYLRETSSARIRFPQVVTLGYSYRPAPDWNFECDIDWTDWHSLKTVTLQESSGNIQLPFNWQSSFLYEFGVTKSFSHGFHVSAGYVYSQTSVPNDSFSAAIPDSNRNIFSVGCGQQVGRVSWALAYQYTYGPTRTVSQGTLADGYYSFDSSAITFSLGYHF